MKISVYLKDPDGFYDAVEDAAKASLPSDLPKDEQEVLLEIRKEKAQEFLRKWVADGEYVGIEFDTDAGTATVEVRK